MIVVSDTTPLNYLVLIGAIDLLPKLFDEVFVPAFVLRGLQRSSRDATRFSLICPHPFLHSIPSHLRY